METKLSFQPPAQVEADALIVTGFDKDEPRDSEFARLLDEATGGWVGEAYSSGEFKGSRPGSTVETILLHRPAGLKAKRLMLVGAGKRGQFGPDEIRKAVGAALRVLKNAGAKTIALALDPAFAGANFTGAAVEGAILADFEPDRYKTDKKDVKVVDGFTVVAPEAARTGQEEAVRRARIVAGSQNFTRDLVNEPANRLTPSLLAERAREMAAASGLECEVLDQDRMRQLGMGSLLGVAQGSSEPPALIVVRYRPEGAAANGAHLGLVGKGVTFDTGGISIKPSDGMEKMKYDMAGGAAVLGAMRAIAELKPAIPVTALVPAVENMPGSRAQRPGDIVTSLSGKTIEVLNTDAEGRLILADALTYAQRLGCTHLIDAATLTGAIVVALGHIYAGVFSNNEALTAQVMEASKTAGEKLWPMPIDDDYKDYLKSAFADIPNIGGRWGGAVTAAMFLKEFAGETPWVHLDIAGTAWLDDAKAYMAKGPTGLPVRTMVEVAERMK